MVIRALKAVTYKIAKAVLTGSPSGSHVYDKDFRSEGSLKVQHDWGQGKKFTLFVGQREMNSWESSDNNP